MKRILMLSLVLFVLQQRTFAQPGYFFQGEVGIVAGAAHYFGDLNTRAALNVPRTSFGIFAKKNFGNYTALRVAANYGHVGYSDKYNKKNIWQKNRKLSFESDIYEFTVQGDFNFFKYVPTSEYDRFTPYITFGLGVFYYNPYMWYLNSGGQYEKIELRNLNTEGTENQYNSMDLCIPLGLGVKFSLNRKLNFMMEAAYRFTTTDYLDDVSNYYVKPNLTGKSDAEKEKLMTIFDPSQGHKYSDLNSTVNTNKIQNKPQRGQPNIKDSYIFVHAGFSVNIITFKCPEPNKFFPF